MTFSENDHWTRQYGRWNELGYEKKKEAGQLLKEVVGDFIKDKKDHIHVYNAVIHLDEAGAPHAHINFIPLAHGYRNGLSTQPSWTKSLAQMGYQGKGRKPFMASVKLRWHVSRKSPKITASSAS